MAEQSRLDVRLALEFLPVVIFLAVNWIAGLFAATAAVVIAGLVAIFLRWRIDQNVPWLAVGSMVLVLVLLLIGFVLDDERFLKITPTVGGVAMAGLVIIGGSFRPPLLARSLGYKLQLVPEGWRVLHWAWAGMLLAFAAINEVLWRTMPTDVWVWYAALDGWATFGAIYAATWVVAWYYWDE
ncbi:MAG: septation protein IspZ [Pseudomonadota bacterium]